MIVQQKDGHAMTEVLTTGQVAKICNVAPRTVSKWFDTGQLRGYRIPGSRDRRIPVDQLVRFMKAHNIPLNGLDGGPPRVVLLQSDDQLGQAIGRELDRSGFESKVARTGFEVGMLVERYHPHVVVLDLTNGTGDEARSVAASIRREPGLADLKLVALEDPDDKPAGEGMMMARRGFDRRLAKPFTINQLLEQLHEVTT